MYVGMLKRYLGHYSTCSSLTLLKLLLHSSERSCAQYVEALFGAIQDGRWV